MMRDEGLFTRSGRVGSAPLVVRNPTLPKFYEDPSTEAHDPEAIAAVSCEKPVI
ncbi:hypothetical protein SS05631_c14770 [Sinorhizobium sp. CCBAU 05631]|nr:hypothetical protein SS05631_c14770 [Sinorhizobium sp. CCBAU 05631]